MSLDERAPGWYEKVHPAPRMPVPAAYLIAFLQINIYPFWRK